MSATRLVASSALVAALAAAPGAAHGEGQRLVLDQATLEPSPIFGVARLRVFATPLDVTGAVLVVSGPQAWKLMIGQSEKKMPYTVTTYGAGTYPTVIAIVVQTTPDFAADLPIIQTVLEEELLSKLGVEVQVGVVGYDEKVGGMIKLAEAKAAKTKLAGLKVATAESEPVLLDAVDRAIGALKKHKTDPEGLPVRKMVIVIADGRDQEADRSRTTRIGKRAARDGVRIHSLAYSPNDTRRPLLLLGELSRQSLGTFRWIRKVGEAPLEQSLRTQIKNLLIEIDQQYVVTFYVPPEEVAGKKVSLVADLLGKPLSAAASVKVPDEPMCGGKTCGGDSYCVAQRCVGRGSGSRRGILGWILLIGGILVGAVVALGLIGFLLAKRQEAQERRQQLAIAAGLTSAPPGSQPPVVAAAAPPGLVDGRIMGVPSYASPVQEPAGAPAGPAHRIAPIVAGGSTTQAPAAAQAKLYIMSGARAGQQIPLRHGFVIGKAAECDLPLVEDGFASGQHAMILMDAGGNCMLRDQGSTNGTFVNGARIAADIALIHGMTIRIGSTDLRFLAQ